MLVFGKQLCQIRDWLLVTGSEGGGDTKWENRGS